MPKEIVLELDAEVLAAAEKIAVERNTDISGLVTQLLEEELGK